MNFRLIRSFTILFIMHCAGLWVCMPVSAAVMARGDGFIIDSSDIDAQKDFFSEKGFESTDVETLNSVLRIRLFVIEARNSGLIDNLPEVAGPQKYGLTEEYYRLFMLYYQHLMETYPVSEDAVLSYYLSYPEKFLKDKGIAKVKINKEDVWALDGNINGWIRNQIVVSKQIVIVDNEFQRLKAKYHVVVE